MLRVEKVDKAYQGLPVLQGIDLASDNRLWLLTGSNGCGKTTLLMLMAAIFPADSGAITCNDQSVLDLKIQAGIGVSASCINYPTYLTAKALLHFHQYQYGCSYPEAMLQAWGLTGMLSQPVTALSLGTQKKLSLTLAMMHQPELLLLDEPSNGLDTSAQAYLFQCLQHYPGQVVIATHDQALMQHFPTAFVCDLEGLTANSNKKAVAE